MAIIKKFSDDQAGGVPVVSGSGGGRARPAAGGVNRVAASGGGGGHSTPGFVNISKMLSLNQGQGKNQANAVMSGQAEKGDAIQSGLGELENEFNTSLDNEKKEAGVGDPGANSTAAYEADRASKTGVVYNSTARGPWNDTSYADNEKYKNSTWDAAKDLSGQNPDKYNKTLNEADNFVKDVNSLSTDGGLQRQIQSKYGANSNAYGSAFDAQLTRENGQQGLQDLQNRYGHLYNTMVGANAEAGKRGDAARAEADKARDYHTSEYNTKKASSDNDKRLEEGGYWDESVYWYPLESTSGSAQQFSAGPAPISYQDYVLSQQKKGKRPLSEAEFKRGQAMHGVVPAENRSSYYDPIKTRKVGTIKQG